MTIYLQLKKSMKLMLNCDKTLSVTTLHVQLRKAQLPQSLYVCVLHFFATNIIGLWKNNVKISQTTLGIKKLVTIKMVVVIDRWSLFGSSL